MSDEEKDIIQIPVKEISKEKVDRDKISLEELKTHNSGNSLWMGIKGKVYDVTEYVKKHPGGRIIFKGVGEDATTLFSKKIKLNFIRQISCLSGPY